MQQTRVPEGFEGFGILVTGSTYNVMRRVIVQCGGVVLELVARSKK
jgi:hypothetical protein